MSKFQLTDAAAAAAADARRAADNLIGAAATVKLMAWDEKRAGYRPAAAMARAASRYHDASIAMDVDAGLMFDSPATAAAAAINVAACFQLKALDALSARSGVAGRDPENCPACCGLLDAAAAIGANIFYPLPGTPDRDAAALELYKVGELSDAILTAIGVADVDLNDAIDFSL